MIEYPAGSPLLQDLFDPDTPNSPALWAVLKGNHPGQALVDDERAPSQCALRTGAALSYFNPQTTQAFLDQAVAHFRQVGPIWLVWPHRTSLRPPAIEHATTIHRVEFYDYDPRSETLTELKKQLPAGCSIQSVDRPLLEQCEWRTEMEFYAGSLDNFLTHGIGLCLLQGDEILVEAYASALGKKRAEIGAITREPYRGRGYAPVACAYLVERCEQRGYQAYWSCDADHHASIRVAEKLGFQRSRAYQIHEYDPL
jgi:RimJ/RimL family protein N-acetyltransferase